MRVWAGRAPPAFGESGEVEWTVADAGEPVVAWVEGAPAAADRDRRESRQDVRMQEVEVKALPVELLASILTPERARRLSESAARAQAAFGDRTIWHVNATASGGGVAEMLTTLLAYGRGGQVSTPLAPRGGESAVFPGSPSNCTTSCTAHPVTGAQLGGAEDKRGSYEAVLAGNLDGVLAMVRPGDIVLLHDPQAAGMCVGGLQAAGAHVRVALPHRAGHSRRGAHRRRLGASWSRTSARQTPRSSRARPTAPGVAGSRASL